MDRGLSRAIVSMITSRNHDVETRNDPNRAAQQEPSRLITASSSKKSDQRHKSTKYNSNVTRDRSTLLTRSSTSSPHASTPKTKQNTQNLAPKKYWRSTYQPDNTVNQSTSESIPEITPQKKDLIKLDKVALCAEERFQKNIYNTSHNEKEHNKGRIPTWAFMEKGMTFKKQDEASRTELKGIFYEAYPTDVTPDGMTYDAYIKSLIETAST
jgi:hypothetical protein